MPESLLTARLQQPAKPSAQPSQEEIRAGLDASGQTNGDTLPHFEPIHSQVDRAKAKPKKGILHKKSTSALVKRKRVVFPTRRLSAASDDPSKTESQDYEDAPEEQVCLQRSSSDPLSEGADDRLSSHPQPRFTWCRNKSSQSPSCEFLRRTSWTVMTSARTPSSTTPSTPATPLKEAQRSSMTDLDWASRGRQLPPLKLWIPVTSRGTTPFLTATSNSPTHTTPGTPKSGVADAALTLTEVEVHALRPKGHNIESNGYSDIMPPAGGPATQIVRSSTGQFEVIWDIPYADCDILSQRDRHISSATSLADLERRAKHRSPHHLGKTLTQHRRSRSDSATEVSSPTEHDQPLDEEHEDDYRDEDVLVLKVHHRDSVQLSKDRLFGSDRPDLFGRKDSMQIAKDRLNRKGNTRDRMNRDRGSYSDTHLPTIQDASPPKNAGKEEPGSSSSKHIRIIEPLKPIIKKVLNSGT